MANRNKQKGNRVERDVVKLAENCGLKAKRAYASNGLSLGHSEETDVLVEGKHRVQVKAKKKFPQWLMAAEKDVDWVVLKEDNKPFRVMLNLKDFLDMVRILSIYEETFNDSKS